MTYSLVVAGVPPVVFDRLRRESENRIAPGGKLVLTPNHGVAGYTQKHADDLIARAHEIVARIDEQERFATLLLYVDFGDESTQRLLSRFFPFSLPLAISRFLPPENSSKRVVNEELNLIVKDIISGSQKLRERSRLISGYTDVANLTPLLLPARNFRSPDLNEMLRKLYQELALADDPKSLIDSVLKAFAARNPRAYAPGQDRHCFCDGYMYFQSPGKHRHGFFRNDATSQHTPDCLLNSRSRIGGAFDYRFHYDCIPVKGGLSKFYENCHGCATPPKSTHVNIAPNDFVI